MALTDRPCEPERASFVACADNLPYMRGLPAGRWDLIYADPPFNTESVLGDPANRGLGFVDRHGGVEGFLAFLEPRMREMHRLLSERGSLFVHVDWRTTHHVRLLLDAVFGASNFLNEIIWHYRSGGRPAARFSRKHDTLLWYARRIGEHTFNRLHDGEYRTRDLKYTDDGRPYKSTRSGPIYFDPRGPICTDVWDIPILSTVSSEREEYPTQKPERLLERIVRAASNEGDTVADFFCGSGTTLIVAARLGRRCLGCDINPAAVEIARRRLDRQSDLSAGESFSAGPSVNPTLRARRRPSAPASCSGPFLFEHVDEQG
jgi:DNA modification methylase